LRVPLDVNPLFMDKVGYPLSPSPAPTAAKTISPILVTGTEILILVVVEEVFTPLYPAFVNKQG
jgi:hypothetical protein